MQPKSQSLAPSMVVAGRYRLVRVLGTGGMGAVWLAKHMALGTEIALKFIDAEQAKNKDTRSRFTQEAMAVAKIKSPHVVNVLDFGTDAGRPYIAMELLTGEDLGSRLDREVRLGLPDMARIVTHACKGLAKAHAAGVVHRDLKPENLFLCEDEDGFILKILDFGIAKADVVADGIGHKTGVGVLLGTPVYMSPEQALGKPHIDLRSDLYSLGTVTYHALTGRLPFEKDNLGDLIMSIATEEVAPMAYFRGDLPEELETWREKAMHKDPAQRFQTAKEMGEAFLRAVGDRALPGAESYRISDVGRGPSPLPARGVPHKSGERAHLDVTAKILPDDVAPATERRPTLDEDTYPGEDDEERARDSLSDDAPTIRPPSVARMQAAARSDDPYDMIAKPLPVSFRSEARMPVAPPANEEDEDMEVMLPVPSDPLSRPRPSEQARHAATQIVRPKGTRHDLWIAGGLCLLALILVLLRVL
jgi:eukaryotic-like serine/threonine-protein kinase